MEQSINDSISHIRNSIHPHVRPHISVYIVWIFFFLISDFLTESLKANKLAKKMTHFTIQLQYTFQYSYNTHFILQTSTHSTLKTICSRDTAKNLCDFTNFPANMFLFSVRKNICTAPFLEAQELLSWSTLKANVCIFLYISMRKCLLQRCSKIWCVGECGGWIISLRQLAICVS